MAKPVLLQTISKLSSRIDDLIKNQISLQEKMKLLESQNQELRQLHEQDLKLLEKANKDIEFLSLSYRLADSPETLISARYKIAGLIRTIDSCIRLIKED